MTSALNNFAAAGRSDFFESGLWSLTKFLFVAFVIAMWLGLAFWVYRDARQRVRSAGAVNGFTALAVLIPFLGPLLYLVLRPSDLLADARERELGLEALERQAYGAHCPDCDFPIDREYLACPACMRKLRDPCVRCSKPLDPRWKLCPYCETAAPPTISSASKSSGTDLFR